MSHLHQPEQSRVEAFNDVVCSTVQSPYAYALFIHLYMTCHQLCRDTHFCCTCHCVAKLSECFFEKFQAIDKFFLRVNQTSVHDVGEMGVMWVLSNVRVVSRSSRHTKHGLDCLFLRGHVSSKIEYSAILNKWNRLSCQLCTIKQEKVLVNLSTLMGG
jgi:hypothetical protein